MELITKWSDGNVTITLNLTELAEMVEKMPERARNIIEKVGFRAEGYMKERAAVDTGAMRNSIFTEIVDGGFTAQVGPEVDYAIYQEFGTHKMAAHPFVTPGALKAAFDLEHLAPELFE